MERMKKVVCLLLACCITVMLLPVRANAVEDATGTCGENLTWSLDTDGTLTIRGNGPMEDYLCILGADGAKFPEWDSASDTTVKSVVLCDEVESIGDFAFTNPCIKNISIPDSVQRIGKYSFNYSTISELIIPDSVMDIDLYAFRESTARSITLPSKLTHLGDGVFLGCVNLTSVTVPDGITTIPDNTFSGCSKLSSVFIPKNINKIGAYAFAHCQNLKDIYFAGSDSEWDNIIANTEKSGNEALASATIHYNATTGTEDKPDPGTDPMIFKEIRYLSGWDMSTRTASFDEETSVIGDFHVDESLDVSKMEQMLHKYVFLTYRQTSDSTERVITDIQLTESHLGTLSVIDDASLTIDGMSFLSSEMSALLWSPYQGHEVLYHVLQGEIQGMSLVEEKQGRFEKWDSSTGRAMIDGKEYSTNELTDMSFLGHTEKYLGEEVTYSVSGDDGYKQLIRIDGLVEVENEIAVFSTEKSLTVKTGDSMWLGFGKIADGEIADEWKKMAIVVSDPTVISLSEYEETEYGYSLEVTGKKQGSTNVTITDTESGAHTAIVITVRDSYVGTYSYAIDNMETFYPNNKWENSIQTNIYDLNGLYINNYQCSKNGDSYAVSFDVYNSRYHTGAVDIYDADGNWIDCEEIKKYGMISSLWDTGEQAYYLLSDAVTGKLLTYEQASFAEHGSISIEVPDGGYFTISNNFAESPGTFLFNSCEILYDGTCTLIDAAVDVKDDKINLSTFCDLVKKEITKDKSIREQFIEIFEKTAKKEIQKCVKKLATNEIDERYADISGLFENLLNSLDISWKHLFKSATGVGESAFTKFAGPAGIALKGCFAFSKESNQLVQAIHLAASVDAPYATVFSSIDGGSINPHGVIVNTNGNIDAEAELHVFRISNDDTIEVVLNDSGDDHLKKYELYNICFVKHDQLVQPSGKVTVRIPIPDGMKGDTCCVYRQESDGTWTILSAHIEGNYLVFETDHFSLYGIVGDADELGISSFPNKTLYEIGDTLEPDGLVLSLDENLITKGFICDPMVLSEAGTQKITVRYGVASTEFDVSVQKKSTDISGLTAAVNLAYTGSPQNGYSGKPTSTYDGAYEISYTGRNTTTYNSMTAPADAGDYTVTIKVPDDDTTYTGCVSLDFTIAKATQSAPDIPKLDRKNHNSVTLEAIAANVNGAAVQYSKDGGTTWQNSPTFTGLDANTEYSFIVRYTETTNYEASPNSSELKVTTDSTPSGGSSTDSDSGSNGYSSSSSSTYSVNVGTASHGTISVSPWSANRGTTVTITVSTDDGYELGKLIVTDVNDNQVILNQISTSKYTFTMPASKVTVKATFAETEAESGNPFKDISDSTYYYDAVLWAVEEGITVGASATTFSPNLTCTRAQAVTFLWRAAGSPTPKSSEMPFEDIATGSYYHDAVLWAEENGITNGTSATTFSPNATCSRAQIVTFLWRSHNKSPASGSVNPFTDVAADAYYGAAVLWAVENGITDGTTATTFSPNNDCTRAQIVTFLYRAFAE